jgi:serine protease
MKRLVVAASLLAALCAAAETTRSTMCQATPVLVAGEVTDRRLIGCGEGFPDNLLWHLDRSDDRTGTLDGRVHYSVTGRGAVVYVVDTGIRRDHNEFTRSGGNNVIAGLQPLGLEQGCADPALAPCWDFPGLLLVYTHGTAVASIIAGAQLGVAPEASLVSVLGPFQASNWSKAIDAIVAHAFAPTTPSFQTAIINISGGIAGVSSQNVPQIEASIRRLIGGVDANGNSDPNGKRFLFVTAAGNSAAPTTTGGPRGQCSATDEVFVYPGVIGSSIDGLVTVGGLSRANTLWSGSCKGPLVEVLAPAETMFVASIADRDLYRFEPVFYISGTSYSTPYVSGMAARLLEINPLSTPAQLELLLKSSPSRADGYAVPVMEGPPAGPFKKRRAVR